MSSPQIQLVIQGVDNVTGTLSSVGKSVGSLDDKIGGLKETARITAGGNSWTTGYRRIRQPPRCCWTGQSRLHGL